MNTDISRGQRICASCGRENVLTASCCTFCFASLKQGVQTSPSPSPTALAEPSPFHRFDKAPLWNPGYTAVFLVLICLTIGIGTCGLGFLLFIALAPTLYRLHRADQHASADYESLEAGCVACVASATLAVLVAASAVITFGAVIYIEMAIEATGVYFYRPAIFIVFVIILGTVFGLLASGAIPYVLVRAVFPPCDRRNRGGPRFSISDED